jgi:hypothetical protein
LPTVQPLLESAFQKVFQAGRSVADMSDHASAFGLACARILGLNARLGAQQRQLESQA